MTKEEKRLSLSSKIYISEVLLLKKKERQKMNRVTFGCMSQSRSMLTMVPRPVMVPTRLSSRGGLWQKFKDNKKRMAQFG